MLATYTQSINTLWEYFLRVPGKKMFLSFWKRPYVCCISRSCLVSVCDLQYQQVMFRGASVALQGLGNCERISLILLSSVQLHSVQVGILN